MKIATFHTFHDAAICLYDNDSKLFKQIKLERLFDKKHCQCSVKDFVKVLNDNEFVPDIVCIPYNEDGTRVFVQDRIRELRDEGFKLMFAGHHLSHVLSGWMMVDDITKIDYGIAQDGKDDLGVSWRVFNLKTFECIKYSQHETLASFGMPLNLIGKCMNLHGNTLDCGGKLMGAKSYGTPDVEFASSQDYDFISENMFTAYHNMPKPVGKWDFDSKEFRDWLATFFLIWETAIVKLFEKCIPLESSVIYSGGVAQNTVVNETICQRYPNLIIPPHCYDGGLALGALAFACLTTNTPLPSKEGFPYWQSDEEIEAPSTETIIQIANDLAVGKIVGWYQGKGELGPRALGNRSILMNPAIKNAKEILNSKVKHREHWRPYAPSVLEECASDWFDLSVPSKYMLRCVQVLTHKQSLVPAITHIDGSSRVQTVSVEDNEIFYSLISTFNSITGIPMLLNTSLNDGGSPIAGSRGAAMKVFDNSDMDVLCIGNTIIRK